MTNHCKLKASLPHRVFGDPRQIAIFGQIEGVAQILPQYMTLMTKPNKRIYFWYCRYVRWTGDDKVYGAAVC